MTDDNELFTAAAAREYVEGFTDRDPDAMPHGGVVQNPKVRRYLSILRESWDPEQYADRPGDLPADPADLDAVRKAVAVETTETFGDAMDHGDMPTLKHFTGDTEQRADVSGIKAIGKVDQLVTGPAPVIVILGEMGDGKTDFSGLLGQRAVHHADGPTKVASNIQSLKETDEWTDRSGERRDGWIPNFPTLKEWVEHEGDPLENEQSRKIFIGDEFSISASGHGAAGHETATKMAPLIYLIRKYNGVLIYIAHGPKSIHPLMWRVGTIVQKRGQKDAVIADEVKGGRVAGVREEITGIPPTDWRFATEEASSWSWERPAGDEADGPAWEADEAAKNTAIWTAIRCKEMGMSDRETAEYVPYSHGWVNSRWKEYEQEGKHRDTVSTVEAICG